MSGWVTLKENGKDGVDKLENAKSTRELLFKLKLLGGFFSGYKDTMYKGRLSKEITMMIWLCMFGQMENLVRLK
ncbi:hypothetical protein C0J52_20292 [Blattella germanica]|nr:hypothetical protein C0J52_20292 [Blattella germanica]